MKERIPTFSISRDWRKRFSHFVFGLIFLCSIVNFMFVILPRALNYDGRTKINPPPRDKDLYEDEFSPIKNVRLHDNEVNRKFCNRTNCKFLLAYHPPTMDTSTKNLEYLTYIKLAESLGRVMVLTNVGLRRISTCQRFSFDFYYDVKKLQEMFPTVKFISQRDFQKWSYNRYDKPSSSHYYLTDGGEKNSIKRIASYSDSLRKVWCLDKFQLKLNDTTPFKQLRVSWNSWRSEDGREILREFLADNLRDDAEVLLIRHDIRQPLFTKELPPLPYAKHIRDSSSKIINSLRPYIAIHWDVEHTPHSILSKCAQNLLTNLQRIVDISQIENFYFASDYPLRRLNETLSSTSTEPFIQSSSKWRYISVSHTKAMKMITEAIHYHTADSLGIMKHLEDDLKDEFENSGIRDILDKLVCIEADYYIGLPKLPCSNPIDAKRSKVIVELRNKILKDSSDTDHMIKDNVTRF